ncbi:hypothetical protein XA68_15127 [Ophiocordyceps unilateralis]|uniref:2'-phosphotransferase n=1 Tax=Ophiocordyceps unilateralis TaxID=268505 RepID=A0A2A9P863_OPHUN|nr:hypothetical protein XA68_15127 [Ophiocordyceps unilateralis]
MLGPLRRIRLLGQCFTSSSLPPRTSSSSPARLRRLYDDVAGRNLDWMPQGDMTGQQDEAAAMSTTSQAQRDTTTASQTKREVQVSRALSRLLRHQAESAGIKLDGDGFAPLEQVLAWGPLRSLNVSLQDVKHIVATNDKQRYTLKPSSEKSNSAPSYLIRANQGHSIKLDPSSSLLTAISRSASNVPARVLHGTYFAFWPAIEASGGLRRMGRNHVHCSTGDPDEDDGVVSGMRRDAELVVELDVEASLQAGVKWWRSENGVVLTEGDENGLLSCRFFKSVTGRRLDVGVLWENGRKRADLPDGIVASFPSGKGRRGGNRGPGGGHQRGS